MNHPVFTIYGIGWDRIAKHSDANGLNDVRGGPTEMQSWYYRAERIFVLSWTLNRGGGNIKKDISPLEEWRFYQIPGTVFVRA